ncbi:MAG: glycosyltransferase [Gammaproteobacteria bacterium]|nr:glycosyltransferase [Gammaproteobacteria bacterium]
MSELKPVIVILAVHNGLRWLAEQAASILRQESVYVSLLINVDNSTDGSEAWCKALAARDERVRVLPTGHSFGSASANFFHLLTQFENPDRLAVALADQDDIWLQGKLIRALDILDSGGYAGYSSNVIAFWPDGRNALIHKAQPQRELDYLFEAAGPGCTYLLSADLVEQVQRLWRERPLLMAQIKHHDWFIYALARSLNLPWFIDPLPQVYYRQHEANELGVNRGLRPLLYRAQTVCGGSAWQQVTLLVETLFDSAIQAPIQPPQSSADFFRLGLKAGQCRRRRLDQFWFFCSCLLMALLRMRIRPTS